ncbi:MAG: helix-turn-helix transcriptional regulator [Halioglobus sp.]
MSRSKSPSDNGTKGGPTDKASSHGDALANVQALGMLPHELLSEPDQLARLQEVFERLDPKLYEEVLAATEHQLNRKQARIDAFAQRYDLTAAEQDLLANLCAGVNTTEYAQERNISKHTVRTHMQRLREKTGAKRQAEVIWMALESNRPKLK